MKLLRVTATLAFLAVATAALSSCAGSRALNASRPQDEAFRTELKKELSTLNLAMDASSEELARTLNQVIGRDLYRGSTRTKGLTADIVRNGPIVVSAADDYVYLTVPVSTSLSYGMFETPAISCRLKFRIAAKVTPDWKISADISYAGLSDLFAEEIGIGPLSIKPRSIIEGVTQPVQKVVSDAVSRKINEAFPLRAQAARAWQAAQKPVLLDRNYNAWLVLTPQEIMLYPLSARNNRVKTSIGIRSYAELVVGAPPAARPPIPLPNLKLVDKFDRTFRIALNADLPYRDIVTIAAPLLLNKDFGSDGKSIVVKGFDVYGNGEKLVVKLETTGSVEGIFYLTCTPKFDPRTNVFSVDDVDFDMQTRSLLLQSADWVLHGTLRDMIHDRINMNLAEKLEQSRDMARKALAQVDLVENVALRGSVASLRFSDAIVRKDRISIQMYSEGETSLVLR